MLYQRIDTSIALQWFWQDWTGAVRRHFYAFVGSFVISAGYSQTESYSAQAGSTVSDAQLKIIFVFASRTWAEQARKEQIKRG